MIDVLIIHYNTPELTRAAIHSLWKHTPDARVTVFDNSDRLPLKGFDGVRYIDNTKGQIVKWEEWLATFPDKVPTPENRWGSAKHCYSVELCMDRFPDGFILMDSDVLIRQDVTSLVDRSVPWKGGVHVNTRRFGVNIPRVIPFLCWINTPLLSPHGIRYFNPQRMWNLTSVKPYCHYDTGAWLLEACNSAGLQGRKIEIKPYIEHYGHGSWNGRKSQDEWLRKFSKLWKSDRQSVRYTVLTYIFGDYEKVHEVREPDPNAEYILVTDRTDITSRTWKIVHYAPEGKNILERMYDVRFHPFQFCDTELVVRLDASIGINRPLLPIIEQMQQGGYDRCLMIHPRRKTMTAEYAAWVRRRGYSQAQADRCLDYMRQQGYPMDYKGLFQSCFEVARNVDVNTEINDKVMDILRQLAPDGHIERINQTILSFVINHYYSDKIRVLPVTEHIITDRRLMTWYRHNSSSLNRSKQVVRPMMFNQTCDTWVPTFP